MWLVCAVGAKTFEVWRRARGNDGTRTLCPRLAVCRFEEMRYSSGRQGQVRSELERNAAGVLNGLRWLPGLLARRTGRTQDGAREGLGGMDREDRRDAGQSMRSGR